MSDNRHWRDSFRVEGFPDGRIPLSQIDAESFHLGAQITYVGERTGLESRLSDTALAEIRTVEPCDLAVTDLASVPAVFQWLVGRYGVHTPAALVHDALIGQPERLPEGMTEAHADRYFRFMLEDLGVPWLRRWLIWTAVALRTRWFAEATPGWKRPRWWLALWVAASVAGMVAVVRAGIDTDWNRMVIALLMPIPAAALWGRQYGAGLIAAYTAPWVLPPAAVGLAGFGFYWLLERIAGRVRRLFGGA